MSHENTGVSARRCHHFHLNAPARNCLNSAANADGELSISTLLYPTRLRSGRDFLRFFRHGAPDPIPLVRRTLRNILEPLEPRTLLAANPAVVDVAVFYTAAARNSVGGVESLSNRVDRAIADTNLIFANSNVDATLRLVWFGEADYKESLDLSTDLSRLQSKSDGHLDAIHARRDATGADLVHLLVADGDDGGRAYQLDDLSRSWSDYGFAVSQARYTNLEYIFAHETMHNLGAGHDDSDTTSRQIPYAQALGVRNGNQTVYTLLGPGTRLPYLSSQALSWRGITLGAAVGSARAVQFGHPADNARVVREFLPLVAANRAAKIADVTAPAARLVQSWVDAAGRTLHIQVALADDTAVNVATLDGGDLRVTTAGGFAKSAVFAGVDRGTNGSQRLARYTVDITGATANPGAYAVTVNAGQIADIGGRFVPAGSLTAATAIRFGDRAGPNLHTAMELGAIDATGHFIRDVIGSVDSANFHRFTLNAPATVTATLGGLSGNLNLYLVRDADRDGDVDTGEVIASGVAGGTATEQVIKTLTAGEYFAWVTPAGGDVSGYALSLSAKASGAPSPPPSTSAIKGVVFRDNNSNGVRESWEPGLGGWRVYADVNTNGVFDTADRSATTDSTGAYTISGLAAGTYIVRTVDQAGYRRTTASGVSVTLAAGQTATAKNFGHTPRAMVSGVMYVDVNRNNRRDTGEAGAGGWTVYLDKNNNGVKDAGEFFTTTDAAGNWSIKDALAGSYVVRVGVKAGYTAPAGSALTLSAGQIVLGKSLGVQKKP